MKNSHRILCEYCEESVSRSCFYSKHKKGKCLERVMKSSVVPHNIQRGSIPENELYSQNNERSLQSSHIRSVVDFDVDERHENRFMNDSCVVVEDRTEEETTEYLRTIVNKADEVKETNIMTADKDEDLCDSGDSDNSSEDEVLDERAQIQVGNVEIWDNDGVPSDDFTSTASDDESTTSYQFLSQILKFIFIWQVSQYISDHAIDSLLLVVKKVLVLLQSIFQYDSLQDVIDIYPGTLYKARKIVGLNRDKFMKHVVCPKCDETYSYEDAREMKNGLLSSKLCSKVEYPNHAQQRFSQPCGEKLMKTVLSVNGKRFLYPYKVYCSQKIQSSIEEMLKRNDFKKLLHGGPSGTSSVGILSDICDGSIYQNFKCGDGQLYFSDKRNLGVMLNVDWFCPFKRSEYSLGVIYLVVLNLPRSHRFLWENVITLGVIPGPKEPSLTINSFLRPHVDELLELWDGKIFDEAGSPALYKVALLATSSDVPATRKCGGFMAHNANKGCSKCLKTFPRDDRNRPDYSGYHDEEWCTRSGDDHKRIGEEWKVATNKKVRENLEFNHGVRYSELFRLPYFDPVRMHLVDPMHNLMLGIAKHTFVTWLNVGILDDIKLELVERKMKLLRIPSDTGRLGKNIGKAYKSFKADEWKHWTLVYSMFSLRGIIPQQDLNIWSLFVNASRMICQRGITVEQVDQAHGLLKMFCSLFLDRYGKDCCVPNMHLSLHLRQCILDYGSVYSFWCFSFERYNGILGKYQTNNHPITIQIMRKFVLCSTLFEGKSCSTNDFMNGLLMIQLNNKVNLSGEDMEFSCSKNLSISFSYVLNQSEYEQISTMIKSLYDQPVHLRYFVKSLKRIKFLGQIFTKKDYRSRKISPYSRIMARHPVSEFRRISEMNVEPAVIVDLLEVVIERSFGDKTINVPIKVLKCFFYKSVQYRRFYGANSGVELWSTEVSSECYIPVKFITGRYVCVKETVAVAKIGNLNCSDKFNVIVQIPSKSIL